MAEEIMEAVQIIRVAYEGIEIAIRIGSGGLNAAQRVVETLIGLFEYEKTMGKTNMKNLLTNPICSGIISELSRNSTKQ